MECCELSTRVTLAHLSPLIATHFQPEFLTWSPWPLGKLFAPNCVFKLCIPPTSTNPKAKNAVRWHMKPTEEISPLWDSPSTWCPRPCIVECTDLWPPLFLGYKTSCCLFHSTTHHWSNLDPCSPAMVTDIWLRIDNFSFPLKKSCYCT
jgi:hypothetical protein